MEYKEKFAEIFRQRYSLMNSGQKEAVDTIEGPVMVLAGPGTGKTEVLAMRIANILMTTDVEPGSILCLTFTEAGVTAMRNRLLRIVGTPAYQVRIHTFHSFAGEIIQSYPEKFAFAKELQQLDDLTRIKIFRNMIDEGEYEAEAQLVPFNNRYQHQYGILDTIKTLKLEGVTHGKFQDIVQEELRSLEANPDINPKTGRPKGAYADKLKYAQRNVEVAVFYEKYQDTLRERGLYDFEDMIMFVIDKFSSDQDLLAEYWERYLYVHVDEYQDTNGAQNQIIRLLGSYDQSPNIFAVGDDDQAIYRFQGANVENLLFFKKQFEGVKVIPIVTNYRSSQLILDAADSLISNNHERLVNYVEGLEKKLTAGIERPNYPIEVFRLSSDDHEARFVRDKIIELKNSGVNYSDIAVIYRRHKDADTLVNLLLKSGIPMNLKGGANVLAEPIVRQFITLLKITNGNSADLDKYLFDVLFFKFLDFDRLDIFKLSYYSGKDKRMIIESIFDDEKLGDMGLESSYKISKFIRKISEWKSKSKETALIQLIEHVASDSGYIDYVFTDGKKGESNIDDINAVNSFFKYVRDLNSLYPEMTLEELMKDIELIKENNITIHEKQLETSEDAVNFLTAHSAKGLEFNNVFIYRFYSGNWGGYSPRRSIKIPDSIFDLSGERHEHDEKDLLLEDERRLAFVSITRAKERLYISYAAQYATEGGAKEAVASQFLSEIDSDLLKEMPVDEYEKFQIDAIKTELLPVVSDVYTVSESKFLQSVVSDFKMSASALNEYIECPLKFKFNRLLKVPTPKESVFILGETIHFALESMQRRLMNNEKVSLEDLLGFYDKSLAKQLMSEIEKEDMRKEAYKLLNDYFSHYQGSFKPAIEVEYGFFGRDIVLEREGVDPVRLLGKIDKMEWLDQNTGSIKVVDYKTSVPKSENDIKGNTKNSTGGTYRQLVFYRLLAELDDRFRPSMNSPKYKVDEVEVDYLRPDNGKFVRRNFHISDQDVTELKDTIFDVMARVRNLEFAGSEDYPLCGKCAYCDKFTTNK